MESKIYLERVTRKMSQPDLAKMLGVTPQTIIKWEKDIGSCKIRYLIKMSSLFECSVDYLIGLSEVRRG